MALVSLLLLALAPACVTAGDGPHPAVPLEASRAFGEARRITRHADPADVQARAEAVAKAERALDLNPGWVAPRRFLDEELRSDLRGPEALGARRQDLALNPEDVGLHYLVGRLEGQGGESHLKEAVRLDPYEPWAQHGLAWNAYRRGEFSKAKRYGKRALDRARDPFERAQFAWAMARYLTSDGEEDEALELLATHASSEDIAAWDRTWLTVELALLELGSGDYQRRLGGALRAARLLREADLTDDEVKRLVLVARLHGATTAAVVREGLAAREDSLALRLRGELILGEARSVLGLGILERDAAAGGEPLSGSRERQLRFALGNAAAAVEQWRTELPGFALNERGVPRTPTLARLVRAARALDGSALSARRFGAALIDAGWFAEARAYASRVPTHNLDDALALDARAAAGRGLLSAISRMLHAVDRGEAYFEPPGTGPGGWKAITHGTEPEAAPEPEPEPEPESETVEPDAAGEGVSNGPGWSAKSAQERSLGDASEDAAEDSGRVRDLDDLLTALGPAVARSHASLGGSTDPERVSAALLASPRLDFGMLGQVVHPGPRFSAEDGEQERGKPGAPVGGLAAELARMGRFGLFGQVGGQSPDGAVMRMLYQEVRSGKHMGQEWSGSVAWCDGADVPSRASRAGASIAGAALHEGYWIDVSILRRERKRWQDLADRFAGIDGEARVERALAVTGLALANPALDSRASTELLLGEADRVRLAVMVERGAPLGAHLTPPTLDEICLATANHEEGHLCDHARFLPLGEHMGRVLKFLFTSGFSPAVMARRLEARAHLTALCVTADPRLPLVDMLQAAEDGGTSALPHTRAYADLLGDFLEELDKQLSSDPAAWPELDPLRALGQQLHLLAPERVRQVALVLAERRGLVTN